MYLCRRMRDFTQSINCTCRQMSQLQARKRFYKNVTVAGNNEIYEISLDHRKLKTPKGCVVQIPNYALALAVANEWASCQKIIPSWMHLTGLTFTAIDNPVLHHKDQIVDKVLDCLTTDTILFQDDTMAELSQVQNARWKPIIDWFNVRFRSSLVMSSDIACVHIPQSILENIQKYLLAYNEWALTGMLYAVESLKSFILMVAIMEKRITVTDAVSLSRLETEFQIQYWGSVEWAHDVEKFDLQSRCAAAATFVLLTSSLSVMKMVKQQ